MKININGAAPSRVVIGLVLSLVLTAALAPTSGQGITTSGDEKKSPAPPGRGVIRQSSPATCGQAALATLFTFHFGEPITEEEMVRLVGARKGSFANLRELRDACRRVPGYRADGGKGTLSDLLQQVETSRVPVLVNFKEPTKHYVLVTGRAGKFILVTDPARGEDSIHEEDFLRRWGGSILVVWPPRPVDRDALGPRKRAAETRIETLKRVISLKSSTRF